MLYVRSLTSAEKRTLRQLYQHGSPTVARRALMLLLSASGWSVPAIADTMKRCRRSVRCWIHACHQRGLVQLTGKALGRPPCSEAKVSAMNFSDEACQLGEQRQVPVIPLTVPETRRLLDEIVWNRRRCPAFVLYWSTYR